MALIPCAECEKEIGSTVNICPHCGTDQIKFKKLTSNSGSNKFNWWAFFFWNQYYAGYGKFGKAILMSFIGFIPLTMIFVAIYCGKKANSELPIGKIQFSWIKTISVSLLNIIIAISIISYVENRDKKNNQATTEQENSLEKNTLNTSENVPNKDKVITSISVGEIKFGMTYKDIVNMYRDFKYKMSEDFMSPGLYIINNDNKEIIRVVSDAKNANDNKEKISEIEVFSSDFKTQNGVYPGIAIGELLKVYPDMILNIDDLGESFSPSNYRDSDSSMQINLVSNDEFNDKYEPVGIYESCGVGCRKPTTKFRKEGKVLSIKISSSNIEKPQDNIDNQEVNQPEISEENKEYEEDGKTLELVKKGTMHNYNDTIISKVFEASFDNPSWITFETKKGRRIVMFTGNISQNLHEIAVKDLKKFYSQEYLNKMWKIGDLVEVQWTISADKNSFEITSMASNSWVGINVKDIIETIYKE